MKRILLVVDTRPDCIKMMSLVKELKKRSGINTILLSTGQHRQMLDQAFETFNKWLDYDLEIMKPRQSLFGVISTLNGGLAERSIAGV